MTIRGITVCVQYDDLLALTLPKNLRHLQEVVVITTPNDFRTKAVCSQYPNVRVYETDAFTRHGARFNKGLAIEEGFDFLGRKDWILIFDADTMLPANTSFYGLQQGYLYGARRRVLNDHTSYHEGLNWSRVPIHNDKVWPGYFQLFHADDPKLIETPWYDVTFNHAGGGDGAFQARWPLQHKVRLNFEVLHLGPIDTNWQGRCTERLDGLPVADAEENNRLMTDYRIKKCWQRGVPSNYEPLQEHVEVPNHKPTSFVVGGKN